jgi:hypothetical protein
MAGVIRMTQMAGWRLESLSRNDRQPPQATDLLPIQSRALER